MKTSSIAGLIGVIAYALIGCADDASERCEDQIERHDAARALELAEDALQQESPLARVYLLNALYHDPSEIQALEGLVELVRSDPENANLRSETRSVLELSLFQVSPADVQQVNYWLDDLTPVELGSEGAMDPEVDLAQLDAAYGGLFTEVNTRGHLEAEIEKASRAQFEYEGLLEAVEQLGNYDGVVNETTSRLNDIRRYIAIAQIVTEVQKYLGLLEADASRGTLGGTSARVRLISASSAFSATWNYEIYSLPDALKEVLVRAEEQIAEYEGKVSLARSRSIRSMIYELTTFNPNDGLYVKRNYGELCDDYMARYSGRGEVERKKQALSDCLADVLQRLDNIDDKEIEEEIRQNVVERIGGKIREAKAKQHQLYQKFAAGVLVELWENLDQGKDIWKDGKPNLLLTEREAWSIFSASRVKSIDLSLVSPEVATVYSKLMQSLYAEMGAEKVMEAQKIIMLEANKRQLDEF